VAIPDQQINAAFDALGKAQAAASAAKKAADRAHANQTEANADDAVAKAADARAAADAAVAQAQFVATSTKDIQKDLKDARTGEAKKAEAIKTLEQTIAQHEKAADLLPDRLRNAQEDAERKRKQAQGIKSTLTSMRDKLARLKNEAEAGEKLLEAKRAVELAQKEFDNKDIAATEACGAQWFPSVLASYRVPKEVGDRDAAKKLLDEKAAEHAALDKIHKKKQSDYEEYQKTIAQKERDINALEKEAQQHADDAAELDRQLKEAQRLLPEKQSELKTAKQQAAALKARREKLEALEGFSADKPADAARANAAAARQEALAAYDAAAAAANNAGERARVVGKRAELDVQNGAVFDTSNGAAHDPTSVSGRALTRYQHDPPQTGQTAKTLAPVLATKTQADFLTHMDAEFNGNKCNRTTEANGNRKYEYPDGTVVRYKAVPTGLRPPPTYSVEVKHTPANPDHGPGDIAFKVDDQGRAVPKNPTDVKSPYANNPERAAYVDDVMDRGHRSIP
jgi:hypothetical protein